MNDTNPTNVLFLGFYDTLTILIPGSIFWIVVYLNQRNYLPISTEILIPTSIMLSTATGYLLLALGNLLFSIYIHPNQFNSPLLKIPIFICHKLCKFFIRENYNHKGIDLRNSTITLLKQHYNIEDSLDDLGLFQMCDIFASKNRLNNDRDVLLAKEGIYRSISALLLLLLVYYFIFLRNPHTDLIILFLYAFLTRLCLYGNNYFKKIRQNQIYVSTYINLKDKFNG